MENKDEEVNKLIHKETYPNEKPQVQLYESKPDEENLESMEIDNSALGPKVHKKMLDLSKLYKIQ